jgi:hypothetical protein
VLSDIKSVEVVPHVDRSAIDALASLGNEGFDVSFLESINLETLVPPQPQVEAPPAESSTQTVAPAQTAEQKSKLDDNIQTHLAGLR